MYFSHCRSQHSNRVSPKFKSLDTFIKQADSHLQVKTLEKNVKKFGILYFGMTSSRQGIVHTIGPEQDFTLPGTTVVCGDSHISTHGVFDTLAFGIGTSEIEHVLGNQTIIHTKSKNFLIKVNGTLPEDVTSKDLIIHIIGKIDTAGGTGCVIEFADEAIENLSMEARMSMCNMSIESGARAGIIKPYQFTFDYVKGRSLAPTGEEWEKAVRYWKTLHSGEGAKFDREVIIDAKNVVPTITWCIFPQDALPITSVVPDPKDVEDPIKKSGMERALKYMGLEPGTPLESIKIDKVFIGSCTNGRIEDLRAAAAVCKSHKLASNVKLALVVPGSGLVKRQAEREGLDKIFEEAGFSWREAGCSMCLGMNPDILQPYERCASTSNRNFEGRQGALSRTHLMSPAMAAAAGIYGHFIDIRNHIYKDNDYAKVNIVSEDAPPEEVNGSVQNNPIIKHRKLENTHKNVKVTSSNKTTSSGGIQPFITLNGIAALVDKANVDTDAIIPKQFLKTIKRTGLKSGLFYEWRFTQDANGKDVPTDFVLNVKPWDKSEILVVTGDNFGCGSSREHAPWALKDFGIKSIIAPSFGDIFYNNSFKNGILPIRLDQETIISKLVPIAKAGGRLVVDLPKQSILDSEDNILVEHFDVEPFRKHCLINGLDDIGITLQKEDLIAKYEAFRKDIFSFYENGSSLLKFQNIEPVEKPVSIADVLHQEW